MKRRYYKKTFENIAPEKQKKILDSAIKEFSAKGYNAANINTIAKNAGISIGGMYRYFDSKESLLMTVLNDGYSILQEALEKVVSSKGDFFQKIEMLLRLSIESAKEFKEINQIYLDISTESLSSLAKKLSNKLEKTTSELYKEYIKEGQKNKTIRKDISPEIISFCIDNLIMMTQFSFTSEYYNKRLKIFAGEENSKNEEALIKGIMNFIKKSLEA